MTSQRPGGGGEGPSGTPAGEAASEGLEHGEKWRKALAVPLAPLAASGRCNGRLAAPGKQEILLFGWTLGPAWEVSKNIS